MPWNNRGLIMLRSNFIQQALNEKGCFKDICKQYGISRKTGYKWLKRFQEEGVLGLEDRSKAPAKVKNTSNEDIELILNIHKEYPRWGAKKLHKVLLNEGHTPPSISTIHRILKKFDCINPELSAKSKKWIRFEHENPNDLWQMDFKGHFAVEEGRCHPLTILDDHSRFSICLKAYLSEDALSVRSSLEACFREYGLPKSMTMDNGPPWKGSYPWRFSRLTVWLMRLGIRITHSRPRHPQTQGKDERFHRSLKEEVLNYYQPKTIQESQDRFDEWQVIYNYKRPHEGINMQYPGTRYQKSSINFPEKLPELIYPETDQIRKVQKNGNIHFQGNAYFLGESLYGEKVGIREIQEDGKFKVYFSKTWIKTINLRDNKKS